jgi:hypothetical protein
MRPGHDATEAWYLCLMRSHRQGLVSHWPVTVAARAAAVAIAIIIALLSPDRSRGALIATHPPAGAAPASASGLSALAPPVRAHHE